MIFFDLVYAWGVIHHSENPAKVISEIRRVLRQDGLFIGMIYHRYSLAAFKHWIKYAVFRWQPWKSFSDVIWEHMESIGTKAYTISEAKMLFSEFNNFTVKPLITFYDKDKFPLWFSQFFPDRLGWFLVLHGVK
jgi:SAM-dependent methyltransferase